MDKAARRTSRFQRKHISNIELTGRDAAILLALHKYRFLTSDHIMALTGTKSRWGINKRLRQLYDLKYIDRPQAQRALFAYAEKRPFIYALGNAGASLLSTRFAVPMPPSVYWTEKNRRVREQHIEHTLGISDFMIEMELLCEADVTLRLIERGEILSQAPCQTRHSKYPFRWKTRISDKGQSRDIAIAPDYVFGIEFLDRPEPNNRRFYFVEVDRGTMPVTRRDILQSSIMRKVQSYADTFERDLPKRQFGMSGFQALFVTTSDNRIADMQAAISSADLPSLPANLFLFRTKADSQLPLPFEPTWTNSKGKPAKLI